MKFDIPQSMNSFLKIVFAFVFILSSQIVFAQFDCIESSRIQPTFQCNDAAYIPVCGCNNVTYRNQCEAYNNYGVNFWKSGVCSGIDLDFYPNPVSNASFLTINLSHTEFVYANADVKIVDMYGKVWVQRIINNFNKTQFQQDVTTLPTGIYVLLVQSSLNTVISEKFSKY